jgi:hypothetical protein
VRLIVELGWAGKIFWVNKAEKTSSSAGALMMSVPSITKISDLRGKDLGLEQSATAGRRSSPTP